MHINYWSDQNFSDFVKFIEKNEKKITNLDYIISISSTNTAQIFTNYLVEKTLKTIRVFK